MQCPTVIMKDNKSEPLPAASGWQVCVWVFMTTRTAAAAAAPTSLVVHFQPPRAASHPAVYPSRQHRCGRSTLFQPPSPVPSARDSRVSERARDPVMLSCCCCTSYWSFHSIFFSSFYSSSFGALWNYPSFQRARFSTFSRLLTYSSVSKSFFIVPANHDYRSNKSHFWILQWRESETIKKKQKNKKLRNRLFLLNRKIS